MKKFTITLMALALVLVAMPVMANGYDPVSESIDVEITVAPYAEIRDLADDITLEVKDNEKAEATIEFDVLANFNYDVKAEIDNGESDALLQGDAEVAGDRVAGELSSFTYEVWINPDDSEDELEYLLAGDYESTVTFEVVAD